MTTRPNYHNLEEPCCSCATRLPTPKNHLQPEIGELHVWQPTSVDPPQWICTKCKDRFDAEARRS